MFFPQDKDYLDEPNLILLMLNMKNKNSDKYSGYSTVSKKNNHKKDRTNNAYFYFNDNSNFHIHLIRNKTKRKWRCTNRKTNIISHISMVCC